MPLNQIQEDAKDSLCYTVIIAYAEFDSHDDKRGFGSEPDVWRVIVHSQTTMQAISRAMQIVQTCRAEIMTDFFTGHPMFNNQEMFSRDDVDFMRNDAENRGVFKSWLDMEPTSIQAHLTADQDALYEMTAKNIYDMEEHVSSDADEFLKGISDDNA